MSINNNIIIWEKWKDPLGFDEPEPTDKPYDEEDEDGQILESQIKKIKCQIISTPLGMIPFNETIPSTEVFNFWTGHCNFAITKKVALLIENTPGVETLNVFTKYRFRIGIGKAFSDSSVMREINDNVYDYLEMNNNYVK